MRLSIAMCTYNGARYLDEQLRSFTAQQRLPDELIVCDDRSTDETPAILERFAQHAPFPVRLVYNPENLGYSRNFAQALELCHGELIALSDQDDLWYPHKLATLESIMTQHPQALGVFSDGDVIDAASTPVGRTLWQSFSFGPPAQRRFSSGGAVDELLRRNVVTGMALLIRANARHLLRDAPASWIHDGWLAFLMALQDELRACPERLVAYRVHGTQQVGTPLPRAAKIKAVRSGVRAYAGHLRRLNLSEYQRTDRMFADLLIYLERQGLGRGAVQAAVRAKQQYAARGAHALSSPRLSRLLPVLAHVQSYARFSPNGLRGLARDLIV